MLIFFIILLSSLIALFFKSARPKAKWLAPVSFVGVIIAFFGIGVQADYEARQLGFANAADRRAAKEGGITDATTLQAASSEKKPSAPQSDLNPANKAPPKRDLRGFSLGMTYADAERHAQTECTNYVRVDLSQNFIPFPSGIPSDYVSFLGTFKHDFDNERPERQCVSSGNTRDRVIIRYAFTPNTYKIYRLEVSMSSPMKCEELIDYVEKTFRVTHGKSAECEKRVIEQSLAGIPTLRVSGGPPVWKADSLTITAYADGSSARIVVKDDSIVKEDSDSAEQQRLKNIRKPAL